MMELSMLKSFSKANRAFGVILLASVGIGLGLGFATRTGIIPKLDDWSPAGAIAAVIIGSALIIGSTLWLLRKTDEHDRHAHLWAMTWSWLALAVIIPSWEIFARLGMTRPFDGITALFLSAIIGMIAWFWMRFR